MPLEEYRRKRDFASTPEPAPGDLLERSGRFTIQRHRATALHYDFRLEIDGVLVSWAVPKGPTLDPGEKRLAMRTEDHPIEYLDFEGVIPSKQYGAGDVIVWDWGVWEPEAETPDPAQALRKGEIKFVLHGEKVRGRFTIIRTDGRGGGRRGSRSEDGRESWLLLHKRDGFAVPGWDAEEHPRSVRSGRTNDEVLAGKRAKFRSQPPAAVGDIDLSRARAAPMPSFLPPMRATLATQPFSDEDWLFEVKWDGYRVEAVVRGGRATIWTRNQQDAARYFPDLAGPAPWIDAQDAIVDGEVVALDERVAQASRCSRTGRASRTWRTPGSARPGEPAPIVYQVFDLLPLDGRSLLDVPLEERKRLLRSRLHEHPVVRYPATSSATGTRSTRLHGSRSWRASSPSSGVPGTSRGEEPLVAEAQGAARARGGGRRLAAGQGSHADLGSLILAVRSGDRWVHAGQVGSGLDARTRRELQAALDELAPTSRRSTPPHAFAARTGWSRSSSCASSTRTGPMTACCASPPSPASSSAGTRGRAARARRGDLDRCRIGRGQAGVTSSDRGPTEPGPQRRLEAEGGHTRDRRNRRGARRPGGDREGGHPDGGRPDVRVTNLEKVIFPGRDGEDPLTRAISCATSSAWRRRWSRISMGTASPSSAIRTVSSRRASGRRTSPGTPRSGSGVDLSPPVQKGPKEYAVDQLSGYARMAGAGGRRRTPTRRHNRTDWQPSARATPSFFFFLGPDTTWEELLVLARLYRAALAHLVPTRASEGNRQARDPVWIGIFLWPSFFDDTRDWVEGLSRAVGSSVPDLVIGMGQPRARRARHAWTTRRTRRTRPSSPRTACGPPPVPR